MNKQEEFINTFLEVFEDEMGKGFDPQTIIIHIREKNAVLDISLNWILNGTKYGISYIIPETVILYIKLSISTFVNNEVEYLLHKAADIMNEKLGETRYVLK
jgi:hypothetical protein